MKVTYDKYYQTQDLFGAPYPELVDYFKAQSLGKVLDIGCGQGRDAIALAHLGFDVVGLDHSKVGIDQMNVIAQKEQLKLQGIVADIYLYQDFSEFDFVLFDSLFHFAKKDKSKEIEFIKKVIQGIDEGCRLIFCIQDTGQKVQILKVNIQSEMQETLEKDIKFKYIFEDSATGHRSESDYRMVVVRK